jgi:predicted proteasome-type protease
VEASLADHIGTAREMFTWTAPDARKITTMTAGNLTTTQAMMKI